MKAIRSSCSKKINGGICVKRYSCEKGVGTDY